MNIDHCVRLQPPMAITVITNISSLTGAYKERGALNKLRSLNAAERNGGVYAGDTHTQYFIADNLLLLVNCLKLEIF